MSDKRQTSRVYKYEDVFTECEDGDLLLTFPEELGEMFQDGDVVDVKVVDGALVINKVQQDG